MLISDTECMVTPNSDHEIYDNYIPYVSMSMHAFLSIKLKDLS